jgi:hypothetical protein
MLAPQAQLPLGGGAIAQAAQIGQVQWSPSPSRGSAGGTLSGGRRGTEATCESSNQADAGTIVTLLVPSNSAELTTTQAQPSLHWHVDTAAPVTLRFVLQDPNRAEPVVSQTLKAQRSGLQQITVPAHHPLRPDATYRWSIFVACGQPAGAEVVARSFVRRIAPVGLSPSLASTPVSTPASALEQASSYAKAGIWYDAIAPLLQIYQQNPTHPTINTALKSLLLQAQVGGTQHPQWSQFVEQL